VEWFEQAVRFREGSLFGARLKTSKSRTENLQALHESISEANLPKLTADEPPDVSAMLYSRPKTQWFAAILQSTTWAVVNEGVSCDFGLNLIRSVRYPQHGPYLALGWRNNGLAASKSNDYVVASSSFAEARARLAEWARCFSAVVDKKEEFRKKMYSEVREQIDLGSAGTAARTLEHLLKDSHFLNLSSLESTVYWIRAYRSLRHGIECGERASEVAAELVSKLRRTKSAVQREAADVRYKNGEIRPVMQLDIIVRHVWTRRPAVMTARCHILAVPLSMHLRDMGALPPQAASSWEDWEAIIEKHHQQFLLHYRMAIIDLSKAKDTPGRGQSEQSDKAVFQMEIAQLRFAYALLFPKNKLWSDAQTDQMKATSLAGRDNFALQHPVPVLEDLIKWLNTKKCDANIWCSITDQDFVAQIEKLNPDLQYADFVRENETLIRKDARVKVLRWLETAGPKQVGTIEQQ